MKRMNYKEFKEKCLLCYKLQEEIIDELQFDGKMNGSDDEISRFIDMDEKSISILYETYCGSGCDTDRNEVVFLNNITGEDITDVIHLNDEAIRLEQAERMRKIDEAGDEYDKEKRKETYLCLQKEFGGGDEYDKEKRKETYLRLQKEFGGGIVMPKYYLAEDFNSEGWSLEKHESIESIEKIIIERGVRPNFKILEDIEFKIKNEKI